MKINRLLKAELRKIFLRPAIFILTALVIVAVFATFYFYVPNTNTENNTYITGTVVNDLYDTFVSSSSSSMKTKATVDAKIAEANELIDFYINNSTEGNNLTRLTSKVNQLKSYYPTFKAVFTSPSLTYNQAFDAFDNLRSYVTAVNNEIATLNKEVTYYLTTTTFDKLQTISEEFLKLIPVKSLSTTETVATLKTLVNTAFENANYIGQYSSALLEIKPIIYTVEDFQKIKTKYISTDGDVQKKLNSAMIQISTFAAENGGSAKKTDLEKIEYYFMNYVNLGNRIVDGIYSSIDTILVGEKSDKEMNSYISFEDFNKYETNTKLALSDFFIKNETPEADYLLSLDYETTTGSTPNAWDFMYYSLEIVSILIILFCIYLASNAIAGEYSSGTIKMLAIRPYSRNKILLSKLLASLVFLLFFSIVASVTALIIGNYLVGPITLSPMILAFNGTGIFAVSPIVVWLIVLASIMLKAIIFITLGLLISVLFKSNISAIVISFFTYIGVMVSNALLSGYYWYKYTPMANLDLYKYLKVTNAKSMFSIPVMQDTNFYFGLIYIGVSLIIYTFLAFRTFKKKDIA